ncbi:MAG: ribosome-associated translation inhibitor RaiA [Pseudomonadota bacterium]
MPLTITGKHMDVGDALRQRIDERVSQSLDKYFDGNHSGHVTLAKTGAGFEADCTLHLDTGVVLRASATAGDATHAFEQAAERIDKRLRRYKRRLKAHHHQPLDRVAPATEAVLVGPADEDELEANYAPLVVAEAPTKIRTMTVGMAVLQLDLIEAPVLMFNNAANSTLNVVFRRSDGNVGWIDPSLSAGDDAAKAGPTG